MGNLVEMTRSTRAITLDGTRRDPLPRRLIPRLRKARTFFAFVAPSAAAAPTPSRPLFGTSEVGFSRIPRQTLAVRVLLTQPQGPAPHAWHEVGGSAGVLWV